MQDLIEKQKFVTLIKSQFGEETQALINDKTEFKKLKEWTSLQTMIVVNEIDQHYGIILGVEDFLKSKTFEDLFNALKAKLI